MLLIFWWSLNLFPLDYLIREVYVERIIVKLHGTLVKAKKLSEVENKDSPISFICDVIYNYFSSAEGCALKPSSEDLLLTLFQLCAESKDKARLPGNKCNCSNVLLGISSSDLQNVSLGVIHWIIMLKS